VKEPTGIIEILQMVVEKSFVAFVFQKQNGIVFEKKHGVGAPFIRPYRRKFGWQHCFDPRESVKSVYIEGLILVQCAE
jgi:hypothetical protein